MRRRSTTAPASSNPTVLQLFLPKSIPRTAISIAYPPNRLPEDIMSSALRRGAPFHKSLSAAEQQRADVARARRRWMREQGMFDAARLVFIDETSASAWHESIADN